MARTAEEYLALIKRYNPYIEVEGTNLMNELRRRAGENADPYSVLNDALNYSESQSGINKEAQRYGELAESALRPAADLETNEAKSIADRLRDSIARNYQRARGQSSLDLQKRGLAQGGEAIESNQFLGSEQAREETGVDQSLAAKLSAISQRLKARREEATLSRRDELLGVTGKNYGSLIEEKRAAEEQAFKQALELAKASRPSGGGSGSRSSGGGSGGSSAKLPYSRLEQNRLREAGIDAGNTVRSDAFLYGDFKGMNDQKVIEFARQAIEQGGDPQEILGQLETIGVDVSSLLPKPAPATAPAPQQTARRRATGIGAPKGTPFMQRNGLVQQLIRRFQR